MASSRGGLILTLQILSDQVEARLVEYSVAMRREMGDVVRQQMRLLVTDLMKLTPPFRSRAARKESWAEQRFMGQRAVNRDIKREFLPIETIATKNARLGPAIMEALAQNNLEVLGRGTSLPELLVKAKVLDTPDLHRIVDAPSHETHNRFRRRGRVPGKLPYPILVLSRNKFRKYIHDERAEVGILKGGWGAAASRFGVHVPKWISRHFSGSVVDRTEDLDHPFAIARNDVPYIAAQNSDLQITINALKDRQAAMERQIAHAAARPVRL